MQIKRKIMEVHSSPKTKNIPSCTLIKHLKCSMALKELTIT